MSPTLQTAATIDDHFLSLSSISRSTAFPLDDAPTEEIPYYRRPSDPSNESRPLTASIGVFSDVFHTSKVTLTGNIAFGEDPWDRFNGEIAQRWDQAHARHQAYRDRIEDLRSDATLDGITLSDASERDFWSFVRSVPFAPRAGLVVVDNGDLRAVWKGQESTRVGLQFLGGRSIEYVILKRRPGSSRASQVAGRDTFDGVKEQLRAFDLTSWLTI